MKVPGDKSISHRALFVAALNRGTFTLAGLSSALDVRSTLGAVASLCAINSLSTVEHQLQEASTLPRHFQVQGESQGWDAFTAPDSALDCGNSGTTARLLTGILAGSRVSASLTGDPSLRTRPMGRVVEPLRAMGAAISYPEADGFLPVSIEGSSTLVGTEHHLPVASAQVKSALIFAGLRAEGETVIEEPGPSRDHTERMLQHLGVHVDKSTHRLSVTKTDLSGDVSISVPGDLSSAAFWLVSAAILPGGSVTIPGVGVNPTRSGILDILSAYGAEVDVANEREVCGEPVADVTVRHGDRRALTIEGDVTVTAVDELPLVAVLGAFAEGRTTVRDARELRVKESDRIAAIVDGMAALGVSIEATPDGFTLEGRGGAGTMGAEVDAHGDHRIAMGLAVAGLAVREGDTSIRGWESIDISYPGFREDLDRLVVR